eukprot:TRINITY_DN17389_c1_g1_i1.p1 TRINITY_DN17389_c1_g1~~TRINITY_DN17389_c1_g1_i1.p1  ORF type:complete len:122 (-),score=28.65 TRINITY_DN17389_c1_g1_i1:276-641(-)
MAGSSTDAKPAAGITIIGTDEDPAVEVTPVEMIMRSIAADRNHTKQALWDVLDAVREMIVVLRSRETATDNRSRSRSRARSSSSAVSSGSSNSSVCSTSTFKRLETFGYSFLKPPPAPKGR